MIVNPADAQLIQQIQKATQGGSRFLCTLARRGKALERDDPERAAFLLAVLRPHPLYKGGRLAFDMLEIEDLMLDALPVDALDDAELAEIFRSLSMRGRTLEDMFLRFVGGRESGVHSQPAREKTDLLGHENAQAEAPSAAELMPRIRFGPSSDDNSANGSGTGTHRSDPELLSSDYLYDYVVLGFVHVLSGEKTSQL